jgi:RNA polymerase sigma-70 factor, ECF subfamily
MPGMSDSAEHSDTWIVARVRAGDADAFAALVARYQAPLLRVARSRLGRLDWAEDVVQEAFLSAFKSCASYDPRFEFRTWLWTILLNQCAAHYHRRMRREAAMPAAVAAGRDRDDSSSRVDALAPLASLLAKERSDQLEAFLLELSAVQADALRLRFFGGLKFQEIADAMQCSLNTAKNRVRWGLMRMAELIKAAETSGAACLDLDEGRSKI